MILCDCGNEIDEGNTLGMCEKCYQKFIAGLTEEKKSENDDNETGFGVVDDEEAEIIKAIFGF